MATTAAKKSATLVEALIALQADLPKVTKDKTNPAFKSKYATLDAVTNAVFPALTKHGLAYTITSTVEEGNFTLHATLEHESGEQKTLSFPITETLPQKVGSAVTYYRRYGLAALTGVVADEDDDGAAESAGPSQAERRAEQAKQTRAQTAPGGADVDAINAEIRGLIEAGTVTKEQANAATASNKDDKSGVTNWKQTLADLKAAS